MDSVVVAPTVIPVAWPGGAHVWLSVSLNSIRKISVLNFLFNFRYI